MKFLLLFIFYFHVCYGVDKIKLKDLRVLTLYKNRLTTARRSSPIPQLQCTGGSTNCKERYLPSSVQCENMGSDGISVQWRCQADLLSNVKFGSIDVNCEGYDYPNDKYVLVGSCGLSYTLNKIGKDGRAYHQSHKYDKGSSQFAVLLAVVGVVIFCIFVYTTCITTQNTRHHDRPNAPPQPPPPGFRPEYTDDYQNQPPPAYDDVYRKTEETRTTGGGNSGWGNFFTGALAGGLGGYLFGSSAANQRGQTPYYSDTRYMQGDDYTTTSRGYGFGTPSQRRSRSSSRESSNSYRTSYGFGGTSSR